jgi:FtsZ-interacting cell division protein ZipA
MNELQLGLIVAGVVIVVAVVLYNGVQGKRVRRRLPRTMDDAPADGGMASGQTDGDDAPFIAPDRVGRREQRPLGTGEAAGAGGPVSAGAEAPVWSGARSTASTDAVATAASTEAAKQQAREAAVERERREPTFGPITGVSGEPAAGTDGTDTAVAAERAAAAAGDDGANVESDAVLNAVSPAVSAADADDAAQHATAAPAAAPVAQGRGPAATVSNLPLVVVDSRLDCIVPLTLGESVTGDRVIPFAVRLRRAGSKPVFVEGCDTEGQWGTLRPGTRYEQLRVAVQLANRSGPLNELEFSEFVGSVHQLADALDASADFPDMGAVVQMARELDGFAAQCDAQLSVNVLTDGAPWSGSYVQAVASQDGLLLSRDGTRFVKLDAQQNPVFTMTFENMNFLRDDLTYKGGQMITLLLDVPVADEDILPWRLMCDYARSLAQRIGARVVDDQRRVLPDASMQAIDDRLMTLYARLEQAGLPAGSTAARRLFSS